MKKNRLLCLILALAMLLTLCACTSGEVSEPPAEESPAQESQQSPAQEEPSAPEEEAQPEQQPEWSPETGVLDYELPLFDETYQVSMYWVQLGGTNQPPKEDLLFWQRVQENLGVEIEFVQVGEAIASEQYNLMIASSEMPDIIWESNCGNMAAGASSAYPNGYDAAIEDEVYMDLTELLPEYAPNYYAMLENMPVVKRDLTTDSGRLYSLSMIYDSPQGSRFGTMVRTDYLDATGMDMPRSAEEWFDCLMAMKANGVAYPFGAIGEGDLIDGPFMKAFGTQVSASFKIDTATDQLVYDATSPECRQYLEYFRSLWENGLVSPDFLGVTIFDSTQISDGSCGVFGTMADGMTSVPQNYGFDVQAAPPIYTQLSGVNQPLLVSYEYMYQHTIAYKNAVVSTSCTEPEKAVTFLDWFYSPAGIMATNYGFVEGESFEIIDGRAQLLPMMGLRNDASVGHELIYSLDEGPMYYHLDRKNPIQDQSVVDAKALWMGIDLSQVKYSTAPTNITLSQEENELVGHIRSDITTFVQTQTMRWLTCEDVLDDASWDKFCQDIQSFGLQELTDVYTAAYQRYLAR